METDNSCCVVHSVQCVPRFLLIASC